MSFQKMKESLVNAYERRVYIIRMKQLAGDGPVQKIIIPCLSGPTGIGKTACVKEFATEKKFRLIKLDCSCNPSSTLAAFMWSAISRTLEGQENGYVLLIDNINEADNEWLELFDQYANNYFDAYVNMEDKTDKNIIHKIRQRFDEIPEGVFIIGEQRSN